jgi:hypothetical protein
VRERERERENEKERERQRETETSSRAVVLVFKMASCASAMKDWMVAVERSSSHTCVRTAIFRDGLHGKTGKEGEGKKKSV